MPRIHALSASVVNQIAAGEVLERPASAIKELLENSLDALSTRIEIDVVAGGSELIRIVDDGEGIHPDDLLLAVTSHATSKIRAASELFGVRTFGFRGEALASIAEVSHLRLRSRTADQDHAQELEVRYGDVGTVQESGGPLGTLIEIRNLFENVPVRRKFLKSTATEFGQITDQFTRIALAHPRLHLVLRHNDRMVYQLPAADSPLDRIKVFFGDDLAEQLIPVDSEHHGIKLWGYVGHPDLSKATRKHQFLFLNGRWIQDRTLQHALTEGYRGLMMVGRHPVAFLFLELPPDLVDVNVHPTKSEVRFQDVQQLFRQVLSTIRSKFLSLDLQSKLTIPAMPPAAPALTPAVLQPALRSEFADWAKAELGRWTPETPPAFTPASTLSATESDFGTVIAEREPSWSAESLLESRLDDIEMAPRDEAVVSSPMPVAPVPFTPAVSSSSPARALQVHDCYIVIESAEGLTVIDQHALHERVLYEQFRTRVLNNAVESQRLLMPIPVDVSAKEAALLVEHTELLDKLGFGVEEFGKDTVLVNRHPVMLRRLDLATMVHDLAERLDGGGASPTRRDLLDELLHMMACKAAVKAGQRLTPEEIDSLLEQRHLCDDAHHCPHGRPTALTLSRAELDRQFGRLGA
ncbi:MAG TPA: DNA mismatch repair endonuclease MutL [Planctomycetaceae bacterium]|nr:DNA mismatch repair endonuclease MutL [Planctomycetaceae bacterium]